MRRLSPPNGMLIAAALLVVAAMAGCSSSDAGSAPASRSATPSSPMGSPARTSTPTPGPEIVGITQVCAATIQETQLPAEETTEFLRLPLEHEVARYGISFPESSRWSIVSGEAEDLMFGLRDTHRELVDAMFFDTIGHRAVIRTIRQESVNELCDLVADWPIEVAIQWGAAYTHAELEAGRRIILDWIREHDWYAATGVRVFGVGLNDATNSVFLVGPTEPSAELLQELGELGGGVNVHWELQRFVDTWR